MRQFDKAAGLSQPLLVPEEPWQNIGMDLIGGFPKVQRYRLVFVIVDQFLKYVVFIQAPPHACPTKEATRLVFSYVVKYSGLPKDTVSNKDSRSTSKF